MDSSDPPAISAYPAGVPRRLGALLYDALLVIALWMGTLFLWVIASGGESVEGLGVQLVLLAELIVFYLGFWSRQGQTLGMAAWHIKLVDSNGQPPSWRQLCVRLTIAPLSFGTAGLGFFWFYVGTRQQTWHDRISDTFVVHIPKTKK